MDGDTIGLIGVGLLGTALAEQLLSAGFEVYGFDVDPGRRRDLEALGGRSADSARDVAAQCRRIVLSLPNSAVAEAVVGEILPACAAETVLVDTTTGDPECSRVLGERSLARGVQYLDATVIGSSAQVRKRDVIVLAGGSRDAFSACEDLFRGFAREWFHVGPCGSGARMKLVVNLVLGLNRAVLAEGLAFARSLGCDPVETLRILRTSAAYSRVMDIKGEKMLAEDFTPQARLSQHLKDVRLITTAGERCGARLPFSRLHAEILASLEAGGYGECDNSAIIKAFE